MPPVPHPDHPIDFVLDDGGAVRSTGPAAAEWLEKPRTLARVKEVLARRSGGRDRAWWASASSLHFRFVPMDGGAKMLVTVVPTRPELAKAFELLTPAQQEVAEYAAAGATNAEIAEATERSPETVRSHVKEIYRRLSICTRLELQWLLRRPAISFEK